MRHSILGYRTVPSDCQKAATLITLHGNNQSSDALLPFAKEVAGGMRIEAPEAARGIYQFRTRTKSTWFGGYDIHFPEPTSFGDSLAQLERFVHDVQNRADEGASKPWLLGYEQGAVLASTIALIAPDLISGVIAMGGGLPTFSNRSLLEPMEGNLPILFLADPQVDGQKEQIQKSATWLESLGNRVAVQFMRIATKADSAAVEAVKAYLDEQP